MVMHSYSDQIMLSYKECILPMILHNRIRCKRCGDIIESESVHDFKFCSCEAVAVDGGRDYLRRCGAPDDYEDLSEVEKPVQEPL